MSVNHEFITDDVYSNMIVVSLTMRQYTITGVSESPINTNTVVTFTCPTSCHVWRDVACAIITSSVMYGCPLCLYINACPERFRPSFENVPRPCNQLEAILVCQPFGHRFLVNINMSATHVSCPVCVTEKQARYGNMTRHNVKFLDTVYVYPSTFLRYKCEQCSVVSMASHENIMSGKSWTALNCTDHHNSKLHGMQLRCRRMFEMYYNDSFEDYDTVLFEGLYPCGYSAKHRMVYFHLSYCSIHPSQESMLGALGLRVIVFPAMVTSMNDIVRYALDRLAALGEIESSEIQTMAAKTFKLLRSNNEKNCKLLL